MTDKQRHRLMHGNRLLILGLSLSGLLMDGFQRADAVLIVALLVWLWLPHWIRLEGRVLQHFDGAQRPWW